MYYMHTDSISMEMNISSENVLRPLPTKEVFTHILGAVSQHCPVLFFAGLKT